MNYELLLAAAREQARLEAERFWPGHQPQEREEFRRKRVVQRYLEFISPIVVDEAL